MLAGVVSRLVPLLCGSFDGAVSWLWSGTDGGDTALRLPSALAEGPELTGVDVPDDDELLDC